MNILTATKDFEKWVNRHTDLIKTQLVPSSSCGVRFTGGHSCSPKFAPELRKAPGRAGGRTVMTMRLNTLKAPWDCRFGMSLMSHAILTYCP
jgi:hypothetical protein